MEERSGGSLLGCTLGSLRGVVRWGWRGASASAVRSVGGALPNDRSAFFAVPRRPFFMRDAADRTAPQCEQQLAFCGTHKALFASLQPVRFFLSSPAQHQRSHFRSSLRRRHRERKTSTGDKSTTKTRFPKVQTLEMNHC